MPYKILDYKDIPNPIAKRILEEYISKLPPSDLMAEPARSSLEYLQSISICDSDRVDELIEKLREFNLKPVSIALLINLRPKTIDELRMFLVFEPSIPDEDVAKRILEVIKEFCG